MSTTELHTALAALTDRVLRLEAHRAAGDLMHRYAAALDDPDPRTLSMLFTPDGVLRTPRGEHRGRGAVAEFFTSARRQDPSDKRHFVCQPRIETPQTGVVALTSYFLYTSTTPQGSALGWGLYEAECRTGTGPAEFVSLTITPHTGPGPVDIVRA